MNNIQCLLYRQFNNIKPQGQSTAKLIVKLIISIANSRI